MIFNLISGAAGQGTRPHRRAIAGNVKHFFLEEPAGRRLDAANASLSFVYLCDAAGIPIFGLIAGTSAE